MEIVQRNGSDYQQIDEIDELSHQGRELTETVDSPSSLRVCRVCCEEDGQVLTEICNCRGATGAIHLHCLQKWIFIRPSPSRPLNDNEVPEEIEANAINYRRQCEICRTPYCLVDPSLNSVVTQTAIIRAEISVDLNAISDPRERAAARDLVYVEFESIIGTHQQTSSSSSNQNGDTTSSASNHINEHSSSFPNNDLQSDDADAGESDSPFASLSSRVNREAAAATSRRVLHQQLRAVASSSASTASSSSNSNRHQNALPSIISSRLLSVRDRAALIVMFVVCLIWPLAVLVFFLACAKLIQSLPPAAGISVIIALLASSMGGGAAAFFIHQRLELDKRRRQSLLTRLSNAASPAQDELRAAEMTSSASARAQNGSRFGL